MNTPSQSLAAFCSHGTQYKRFATDADRLQSDVERLLGQYGTQQDVRAKILELLSSAHFASGFRFESSMDHHDPNRTVVYATLAVPLIDGHLQPAFEQEEDASSQEEEGAWRRSA